MSSLNLIKLQIELMEILFVTFRLIEIEYVYLPPLPNLIYEKSFFLC